MSYHIYTTKGIVFAQKSVHEADRIYTILTRDLGLVYATASGSRKESSKLRGCIEPFSISVVSLVRGREHWRLTSATLVESLSQKFKDRPELFLSLVKNFSLIQKLVAGEEKHPELFDDIETIIKLASDDDLEEKDTELVEILLATRALFNLGYISKEEISHKLLEGPPTKETLIVVWHDKKAIIKAINQGIQSSHLG